MSTSSEEFRKFVNRLLYEDASKLNFQLNMKISFNQTAASQIHHYFNSMSNFKRANNLQRKRIQSLEQL